MATSLERLIAAKAVDPFGNAWVDYNTFTTPEERYAYDYKVGARPGGMTPYGKNGLFDQSTVNNVITKLDSLQSSNAKWNDLLNNYNQQNGDITTTEQENYLRSLPEYGAAWQSNKDAESYLRPLGLWNNTILGNDGGVVEPKKGRQGFNIGGALAGAIGKNPWLVALPMAAAAAPALIGASGLGASAGTAATTAAAAPAASGGFFSSLAAIPSTVSSYLGGGTLGSIGAGAVKGAAIGGLTSGLTGQNIGKGALYGGLSGGALGGASNLAGQAFGGTPFGDFFGIDTPVTNADTGFLSKAASGSGLPWSSPVTSSFKFSDLLGGGDGFGIRDIAGGVNDYMSNKSALKSIQNGQNNALNTLQPYLASGGAANARLSDLLGTSGNSGASGYGSLTTPFTADSLQDDAGYQFRLKEGQKALDRQQSARGGFFSGNALKAAQNFGQGLADTTFNDAYQRDLANKNQQYGMFAGQAGQGLNAAGAAGTIYTQAGQAKADSTIKSGNMFSQLLAGSGAKFGRKQDQYGNVYYA